MTKLTYMLCVALMAVQIHAYDYHFTNGTQETISKITLYAKEGGSIEKSNIKPGESIDWYNPTTKFIPFPACMDGIAIDHPRLGQMFTRPGRSGMSGKLGVLPGTSDGLACRGITATLKYDMYGNIIFEE